MAQRDFSKELQAARDAQDWAAHERIWEDRRVADVAADEADLHALPDEQGDDGLYAFETSCEQGWLRRAEYDGEAQDEMARDDMRCDASQVRRAA